MKKQCTQIKGFVNIRVHFSFIFRDRENRPFWFPGFASCGRIESIMIILITGGMGQGKTAYAKTHFPHARCVDGYENVVRQNLLDGQDPLAEAEKLCAAPREGDLVIVLREMGCGLVPMDTFERDYREANGRVACLIAGHADLVVRVIAGIGQVIRDTGGDFSR